MSNVISCLFFSFPTYSTLVRLSGCLSVFVSPCSCTLQNSREADVCDGGENIIVVVNKEIEYFHDKCEGVR